jgi:uncharacterized protein YjiS (DUF1127 family)
MAALQSHRNNIVWLANSSQRRATIERITNACNVVFAPVLRRLAERSNRRQAHARLSLAERSRQRRALAMLSERDLKDIGVSRYDVEIELRKPFWR